MDDNYIILTTRIEPAEEDETGFVAYCPELGISSQGETLNEALRNIHEAVAEVVQALEETGDLVAFLHSHQIPIRRQDHEGNDVLGHVMLRPGQAEVSGFRAAVRGVPVA
jgi:predicted RNase H-like HicB family nuclease